jgi:hypothetical protein
VIARTAVDLHFINIIHFNLTLAACHHALHHRTSHVSAASAETDSASSRAFRARKLIPNVPNWAALDACGAPA